MRSRLALVAGLLILAASLGFAIGAVLLAREGGRGDQLELAIMGATLFFPLVGTIIIAKRPEHLIGWLFGAIGLIWTSGSFAAEHSVYAAITEPGSSRGAWLSAWYGEWFWILFWFFTLVVTPMLFPTGRALSKRWGVALRVILPVAAGITVLAAMDPSLEVLDTKIQLHNPWGTSIGSDPDESWLGGLLFPLMLGSAAAAAVSLVLRFRRSRGDERQQLKWFTFSAVILVTLFVLQAPLGDSQNFVVPALALVPITTGIAILKYRLYDIDVVINRTLVYGSLSAVLAGFYLLIVVSLQAVLPTGGNQLAVAGSTLAVAALFGPLRRRFQEFIDRRFYRSRYDATQTLSEFASRMKDQVDLDALTTDLVEVVADTMRPSHVQLWIRKEARSERGEAHAY